eukprot:1193420-Prorocentrum_minimum.AAC.7
MFYRCLQAAEAAHWHDWQGRWRLGLLQQRMGRYKESNRTLVNLFDDFTGLEDAYQNLHILTSVPVSPPR